MQAEGLSRSADWAGPAGGRSPAASLGLQFLAWTFIGLSFASQFHISSGKAGVPVGWAQAIGEALGDWYVFALLSPVARGMSRWFRLDDEHWSYVLPIHLAASAGFSVAYMLLRAGVSHLMSLAGSVPVGFGAALGPLLVKTWHFNLLVYWILVLVHHALEYYRRYQDRERHNAQLERDLALARLEALQMQLNPHFLFNSLNAISALMQRDVDAADRMLVRLSELLRHALDTRSEQEIPLGRELEALKRYLDIEQIRFGERLRVSIDVPAELRMCPVPNLILQPLVENAIRHGIEPRARPGHIRVEAERLGDSIELRVMDDGVGLGPGLREGIGLSNTRSRILELHGDAASLRVENAPGPAGGVIVAVRLPIPEPAQS